MGGSCGTHAGKRNAYRAWWENQKTRVRLEDLPADGKIILKLSERNRLAGSGLTDVFQNRDNWRADV